MIVDDDILFMDGFRDDCIVGIGIRFGQEPIIMYDYDKVIAQLMEEGLTEEDAIEWFDYNIIGAWVGERTPGFIVRDWTIE